MQFLNDLPKLIFFTGKGGVGKTSLACGTALKLAEAGKSVLLISTDPASNLADVFGQTIGEKLPTAITNVKGLFALNINPSAAAQAYRGRLIEPVRSFLPAGAVRLMEEELSGACTTEIAAFDEFTGILTDREFEDRYDHIIFDTAPTGHTLRLLQLPLAWRSLLDENKSGASCLGPLSGLAKQREQYAQAVEQLKNNSKTRVIIVARLLTSSLREAERTHSELQQLGIFNQMLVLNGVLPESATNDSLYLRIREHQQALLQELPEGLRRLPKSSIALSRQNMVGLSSLRQLFTDEEENLQGDVTSVSSVQLNFPLQSMIEKIAAAKAGLVLVMGKGGVGKTTIASAIAIALAQLGHSVHLTTTDPAAHLAMTFDSTLPNLFVDRIDPHLEKSKYEQAVLESKGVGLDAAGFELLKEDLRSPCTEEIAVFQAFAKLLDEAEHKFVIVDTAPTGHTLLLLDATGAYHRELQRHSHDKSQITPLMKLQDEKRTKVIIATLPEPTPVHEAEQLLSDLKRAGIGTWGWVANCCLSSSATTHPLLVSRGQKELPLLQKIRDNNVNFAILPYLDHEPVGEKCLLELAGGAPIVGKRK